MTSIAEHLIDLAQLVPEQFAEQPIRRRRTRRSVNADGLYRAFLRQQVRRAARKLEDPETVLMLEWALLQIAGCLRPGEAALAPVDPRFPFRRGHIPALPRPVDIAAQMPKHPVGEHRRRRAAELLAAGHISAEAAARAALSPYGR